MHQLELLDPILKMKLLNAPALVDLMCVQENPDYRPTIAIVVSYPSNLSVQMPFPQEPAFVMHGIIYCWKGF